MVENMKMNWKDFVIALLLGTLVCILSSFVVVSLGTAVQDAMSSSFIFEIILMCIWMLIPLAFYLWRNSDAWMDTAIFSFIYGSVFLFFIVLLFMVLAIIENANGLQVFSGLGQFSLASVIFMVALIVCANGLLAAVLGCAVKYVIGPPKQGQKNPKGK
jgi:hypothetical protein